MKLTNQDHKQAEAIVKYVAQKISLAGSQAEAARMLAVSDSHLISLRDGKWENISRRLFNKMVGLAGLSSWATQITQGFERVAAVADEAQGGARMIALCGFTGAGKTHALREYADANPNCYYLLTTALMSRLAFAEALARACGVREADMGVTPRTIIEAVIDKLNRVDQPLVILDDFGKVTDDIVRMVQIIYDATEGNAGILLSGTEHLEVKIAAKVKRDTMGFREFSRRIAWWQTMPVVSRGDVATIAVANGIADRGAHDYLYQQCRDLGTLRNQCQNAVAFAEKVAATEKTTPPITRELLAHMNVGRRFHTHAA